MGKLLNLKLQFDPVYKINIDIEQMKEKHEKPLASRSDYDYQVDGLVLAIEDLGGAKSVTNDIENVLQDIRMELGDLSQFYIMYKDSMSTWDGIELSAPNVISFFSINEKEYNAAKTKLLSSNPKKPMGDHAWKEPMKNRRMQEKLDKNECIDVSQFINNQEGAYLLTDFKEGVDYCNAKTEQWIWSIGRENSTGLIYAAHDNRFYQHEDYTCIWLR